MNYLGLTACFVTGDYELYTFDLCCSPYNEVDKTGESVLQAIRKQLDLFGLLIYMDNYKLTFTSDRGSNMLKALKTRQIPVHLKMTATPSSSKYVEANTLLSELASKPKEVLNTITTNKKLVKYVGLNKDIEDRGGVALKQESVIRWISLSNMLESIDASIELIRTILLSKSSNNQLSFKLNNINVDVLKDLIILLKRV
ncbi:unnamed protein product [Rotaria sp. Silwood1]|nr:unnamed protein product [Rotaria sp. Silwood1]CAF1646809.1 unnamed protein product [Rotaria sp. Silwood1]CAF3864231.1 unnamed protein product [Rotaria sp. Silwood1]CAF3866306.1 unnamed protein product [Rotaria sp. Silwood1]CAF4859809.1 unnamed protein product [Rotaria sp. Silwood1]